MSTYDVVTFPATREIDVQSIDPNVQARVEALGIWQRKNRFQPHWYEYYLKDGLDYDASVERVRLACQGVTAPVPKKWEITIFRVLNEIDVKTNDVAVKEFVHQFMNWRRTRHLGGFSYEYFLNPNEDAAVVAPRLEAALKARFLDPKPAEPAFRIASYPSRRNIDIHTSDMKLIRAVENLGIWEKSSRARVGGVVHEFFLLNNLDFQKTLEMLRKFCENPYLIEVYDALGEIDITTTDKTVIDAVKALDFWRKIDTEENHMTEFHMRRGLNFDTVLAEVRRVAADPLRKDNAPKPKLYVTKWLDVLKVLHLTTKSDAIAEFAKSQPYFTLSFKQNDTLSLDVVSLYDYAEVKTYFEQELAAYAATLK